MKRIFLALLFGLAVLAPAQTQDQAQGPYGIAAKRPVFAGACHYCPWGAIGDVVRDAMKPYGYDVQMCYQCASSTGPRQVSDALVPQGYTIPANYVPNPNDAVPIIEPKEVLPKGPVDFGATSVQNLRRAWEGRGDYAKDNRTRPNYRVFGTVEYPNFLIAAAPKESGITDLSQLKGRTAPLRVVLDSQPQSRAVLKYYGHTEESIKAGGGKVASGIRPAQRKDFDLVIFGGTLSNAPEQNIWYDISQRYDLVYLPIPEEVLAELVKDPDCTCDRVNIPIGLLRGVDRLIPTVARHTHAVYGRVDAPDDFAYAVAKAMDEQQGLWMWASIPLYYDPKTAWKAGGLPLHPGAERYYREKGYMK